MTHRCYCFTEFDWQKEWDSGLDEDVKYAVAQMELCPSTGKLHWQGYIELNKPMRALAVKEKYLSSKAHIEPRNGTRDQARSYCMKDESRFPNTEPVEWGNWTKGQGHRSDLEAVTKHMKKKGLEDTIEEFPVAFLKYHNGMEKLNNFYNRKKWRDIKRVQREPKPEDYILQCADNERDQMAGYMGQKSLWVESEYEIRPYMIRKYPLIINGKSAEWTEIGYLY